MLDEWNRGTPLFAPSSGQGRGGSLNRLNWGLISGGQSQKNVVSLNPPLWGGGWGGEALIVKSCGLSSAQDALSGREPPLPLALRGHGRRSDDDHAGALPSFGPPARCPVTHVFFFLGGGYSPTKTDYEKTVPLFYPLY